jgi:hypothetical protein
MYLLCICILRLKRCTSIQAFVVMGKIKFQFKKKENFARVQLLVKWP